MRRKELKGRKRGEGNEREGTVVFKGHANIVQSSIVDTKMDA